MSSILLARSSPEVCSIPLPLHTRCAPVPCPLHSPHIFRGLAPQRDCSFRALRSFLTPALQSQTRRWYRCAMCLCPDSLLGPLALSSSRLGRESKLALLSLRSVGSGLRSVPSWTQTLSAFRSYLPAAYRVCFAPQSSAESSEPSGKGIVPQPLPPVSSALTAPSRSASTRSLTSRRRPDSPVRRSLPSLPLFR